MSYPPPQGNPPPGNPVPPQGYPGQWGPPPQQPPWPQQWQPGPPPKKRGSGWKWALGAVALLAVIGMTVAVTVSVTSGNEASDDQAPTGETYGLASANDTGPANIITEDPSCVAWTPIIGTLASIEKKGWDRRDRSVPASEWSAEQRAQYEEVGRAMRDAANQTVQLVKLTPHRVVRNLYEQFIAYARMYSDSIPGYTPKDNLLAGVVGGTSNALVDLCSAISFGSAEARAPLIPVPPPPSTVSEINDPADAQPFLERADGTCPEWHALLENFDAETKAWQALDPGIAASVWNPQQREVIDAVIPVMTQLADHIEELGGQTTNPILRDFATLAAQYRRAYALALPTYTAPDSYLAAVSASITSAVYDACKAAEG